MAGPDLSEVLHLTSPKALAIECSNGLWVPAPHLELINDAVVAASLGQIERLLVTVPPRHGKSELCSHWLPAWYLSMFPDRRVMLCSYEAEFARGWGRKVRDVFAEHGEGKLGVRLRDDMSAADRWDVEAAEGGRWVRYGGGMVTAGVGGPITGKGANLLIIDDPVKNAADSLSSTMREAQWQWYLSTARPRLEPAPDGTPPVVVLIMTLWHEEDLAGKLRMAEREGGDSWTVIRLPALAEPADPIGREVGEALWPERFSKQNLEQTRTALGSYWFNALYQASPQPPEGMGTFRRTWFEIVEEAPRTALRVRYWDWAATQPSRASEDPDYTVGALLCLSTEGVWYLEEIVRAQFAPLHNERLLKQVRDLDHSRYGRIPVRIEQEPGSEGKQLIDLFARSHFVGWDFKGIPSSGSKQLRAAPVAAAAEAGNFKLVRGSWNREYLEEAELFPFGPHDDQVDATSGAMSFLAALKRGPMRVASPSEARLPGALDAGGIISIVRGRR